MRGPIYMAGVTITSRISPVFDSTQNVFSVLFQYKHAELCRSNVINALMYYKELRPVQQTFGKNVCIHRLTSIRVDSFVHVPNIIFFSFILLTANIIVFQLFCST